ncbi:hypothetical protein ACJX0J_016249, partial [Zea mays]
RNKGFSFDFVGPFWEKFLTISCNHNLMLHQWISFSGVVYGVIKKIIALYFPQGKEYGIIDIDKTRLCYLDEPYILGSQDEHTIGYEKDVKLLTGKMVNATSTYLHVMDAIPTTLEDGKKQNVNYG